MRRTIPRSIVALLALGLLVASLAACGGGSEEASNDAFGAAGTESRATGAGGASTTTGGSAAKAPNAQAPSAGSSASSSAPSNSQLTGTLGPMIIRTGEMHLSVESVVGAIDQVRQIAIDQGGVVFSSSSSMQNDVQIATLTLQIPSDRFDVAVGALRQMPGVGKVEREVITSQDVTEEFLDLQSRLRNLNATESRYLSLLQNASRLEDILALERELARVRGEIEQVTGRIKFLESRTQFSRLTVTLRPVSAPSADSSLFDPVRVISDAWERSLEFTGAVASALLTVVVFFWWLWPLLVAAGILLARMRPRRRPVEPTIGQP